MQNKIDSECSANISDDSTISDKVMIALRKIIRSIDMNSKKLVKRVGLTGPQLMILREIAVRNDITPGEIATAVSLSQATVTGILERMEKRELLTRKRSENDKRRSLVRLTELGRQTIENAPPFDAGDFRRAVYQPAGVGTDADIERSSAPGCAHGGQGHRRRAISGNQLIRERCQPKLTERLKLRQKPFEETEPYGKNRSREFVQSFRQSTR